MTMSDFQCGDSAGLIAYAYGECEPAEHASVAAHAAQCPACAGELEAIADTRRLMAGWAPPEVSLGVRVTSETIRPAWLTAGAAGEPGDPSRLRAREAPRPGWWRQPLPAWAQAAAAAMIFAAGLAVGALRAPATPPADAEASAAVAALEARLAAVEQISSERIGTERIGTERIGTARVATQQAAAGRQALAVAATPADVTAIMGRVRSEIASSERRMQGEFAIRLLQVANEMSQQQRLNSDEVQTSIRKDFSGIVTLMASQR
jgi:anti-sigma factor RsiW